MKRNKIALSGLALVGVGGLVLAGCTSGGGTDDDATEEPTSGSSTAIITADGSEPENPLLPADTNETGGGQILDSIFAGLVYYDVDGAAVNDMAEEITVDDEDTLTVTLKEGQTFTDGEEVTADNFTEAWNYGAQLSNAQQNQSWFSDIEGFSADADSELTGLEVVDDYTFTVNLNKPVAADFALRLGYSAYYPLPDVAFEDIAAYGEAPIGNGPYMLASEDAWQHDVQIDLVKNEDYQGGRAPQNGGLTFIFYASADAAYADLLAGNLDVLDAVPTTALETFESDLGENAVNQAGSVFRSITIPERLAHFSGEEGKLRRQAISKAINREEVTETIFNGTRTVATDFTSPVIDGWSDSIEGSEVLDFDPEGAKELWAEADAIAPWSGSFQIAYNADASHQPWVDAVANQIKNTLGIDASGAPYVDFASLRQAVSDRTITTAFRTGWQPDYPGLLNYLLPLYATDAGSNDGDYSNPELDALLDEGASADSLEASNEKYVQAQEILFQDLPAIPLWYDNVAGGYAEGVDNVSFGWNQVPVYYLVTKSE